MRIDNIQLQKICSTKTNFSFYSIPPSFKGLEGDIFIKTSFGTSSEFDEENCFYLLDDEIKQKKLIMDESQKLVLELEKNGSKSKLANAKRVFRQARRDYKNSLAKKEVLKGKINPNVAFLYDENLNWKQKKQILNNKPEIIIQGSAIKDEKNEQILKDYLFDERYFITNKIAEGKFVDTSFKVNRENYLRLKNGKIMSFDEFCSKFGFDEKELKSYINAGLIPLFKLKNFDNNKEDEISLIDMSNSSCINKALLRHNKIKKLKPRQSEYTQKQYISTIALQEFGFGDNKKIYDDVKYKNLSGKIVSSPTRSGRECAIVDFKNPLVKSKLFYQRKENGNILSQEEFEEFSCVDTIELENALLSNKVQPIGEYLYEEDKGVFLFDLENPKNKQYCAKRQIEDSLAKEQLENYTLKPSLIAEITCACYTKMKDNAKSYCEFHPEIMDVFNKVNSIQEYRQKEKNNKIHKETEPYLTMHERKLLDDFREFIWSNIKEDEYNFALKIAQKSIEEFKENGLESVSLIEARNIIREYYN